MLTLQAICVIIYQITQGVERHLQLLAHGVSVIPVTGLLTGVGPVRANDIGGLCPTIACQTAALRRHRQRTTRWPSPEATDGSATINRHGSGPCTEFVSLSKVAEGLSPGHLTVVSRYKGSFKEQTPPEGQLVLSHLGDKSRLSDSTY